MQSQTPRKFCNHELFVWAGFVGKVIKCQLVIRTIKDCRLRHLTNCRRRDWTHAKKYIQELSTSFHLDTALLKVILYETLVFHLKMINIYFKTALPRIMNFGLIRIPNDIRIFKNDDYEYEYYSEFKKLFEYYSWEIFE